MAGVRGFKDPNVVVSNFTGKNAFYQPIDSTVTPKPPTGVSSLLPWHITDNYSNAASQCMLAGSNGFKANQGAYHKGNIDRWALNNTAYSTGYYKRSDIPLHFALAEEWTVSDAYSQSIIASTNPNRVAWVSGSNGIDGGVVSGYNYIDNNETPGSETAPSGLKISKYPLEHKTTAEYLNDVGISWQVYQDTDNFDDNALAYFKQYQQAAKGSTLASRGMSFVGIDKFVSDAKAGTLPAVSYIVGPQALSEHPAAGPTDGAWLQRKIVEAVVNGANWDKTALFISYDETGGWADHVMAPHPPQSEGGEWFSVNPYSPNDGPAPAGPGFRLPFTIVSPWTRKGGVFTEWSAHESQILFLEQWAAAQGKGFTTQEMNPWRRRELSNLVRAFDFSAKDVSVPDLPTVRAPTTASNGQYNGQTTCQAANPNHQPSPPYGKQNETTALATETGFKALRGNPTEGRFLTFESGGNALTFDNTTAKTSMTAASSDHSNAAQRFILHATAEKPSNTLFNLSPFNRKNSYLTAAGGITTSSSSAAVYNIVDLGNGAGYTLNIQGAASSDTRYKIYSVTY